MIENTSILRRQNSCLASFCRGSPLHFESTAAHEHVSVHVRVSIVSCLAGARPCISNVFQYAYSNMHSSTYLILNQVCMYVRMYVRSYVFTISRHAKCQGNFFHHRKKLVQATGEHFSKYTSFEVFRRRIK
jgi:hypothetical protein